MSTLVSFREVDPLDAAKILSWRRSPSVTAFMNTDVENDEFAQAAWLSSCYGKSDYCHWIFSIGGAEAGLISIADFNPDEGTTSFGYYMGVDSLYGFGALVPPYLYNWLFCTVGISWVEVEVFGSNDVVLRMHTFHGYRRVPRRDRKIVKSRREIQLLALELSDKDWLQQRRMKKFVAEFPTNRWSAAPLMVSVGATRKQASRHEF